MTQQRKRHSFAEAWLNVAIGFAINFLANTVILPFYGIPFHWQVMLEIGVWYTIVSVIRAYWVRRLFVWLHDKGILV